MKRIFIAGLAAVAALAGTAANPARADFFSLDGRFQCLERGESICGDAQALAQPYQAQPPAVSVAAVPVAPQEPALPIATTAAAPSVTPSSVSHNLDPLPAIAARVRVRRPSSNDLAWLAQAANHGEARAIELLAWCKLNGIGMARDPVAAYLLYGAVVDAALPHARDNQALIYERDLDSDQRQQVLDLANQGVTLARLSPSAR
jgi:TPR repeat protein